VRNFKGFERRECRRRGSPEWEIYTADPKYRKFDRLRYQVIQKDRFGKRYRVPPFSCGILVNLYVF
jgi:hypothetical protein